MNKIIILLLIFSPLTFAVEVGEKYISFMNQVNKVKNIDEAQKTIYAIEAELKVEANQKHFDLLKRRFMDEVRRGSRTKALNEFRRTMSLFLTKSALREFNPRPSTATVQKLHRVMSISGIFIFAFFGLLFWNLRQKLGFIREEVRFNREKHELRLKLETERAQKIEKQQIQETTEDNTDSPPTTIPQDSEVDSSFVLASDLLEELLVEKMTFRETMSVVMPDEYDDHIYMEKEKVTPLVGKYIELSQVLDSALSSDKVELLLDRVDEGFRYSMKFGGVKITGEHLQKEVCVGESTHSLQQYLGEIELFFKREAANIIIKNIKKGDEVFALVEVHILDEKLRAEKQSRASESRSVAIAA